MPHPVENAVHDVVHRYRQAHGLETIAQPLLDEELTGLIVRAAKDAAEQLAQDAVDQARAAMAYDQGQRGRAQAVEDATEAIIALGYAGAPATAAEAAAAILQVAEWITTESVVVAPRAV